MRNATPEPHSTRERILDAFADELTAVGYPGVALERVARCAGVRKPSLYHHFPGGKAEIFTAVSHRFIDEMASRLAPALRSDGSIEDRLGAFAAAAHHDSAAVSFEQRIYDSLSLVSTQMREEIMRAYSSALLSPTVAAFTTWVNTGTLTGDPAVLADAFLHLCRSSAPDSEIVRIFLDGSRTRAEIR